MKSDLRRGASTANAVWGNKASVLVGDFLFSRSFELMIADGSLDVLGILSEAASVIAEGEVLQLMTANDTETTEEDYLAVIRAKTARLFAAAAEIGGVVADRAETERAALRAFGHNLGMAFQLTDDVLDYSARQVRLGKDRGRRLPRGQDNAADRARLPRRRRGRPRVLAAGRWRTLEQKKGDLKRATALLERTGALRATLEQARRFAARARQALDGLPEGEARAALHESLEFTVERSY